MSDAVRAIDLHFSYDAKEAVSGVSLAVGTGQFVSILGPNGSGKTTLIRLLAGALSPAAGRVEIFGRDISRTPRREAARTIAVVPQGTDVVFPFTVEEVVLMGRFSRLGPYGFEGEHDLEVAREAMRLTDTHRFAARLINDLSGGERQRVIIARAIAQEPRILLLDEPTTFLDIRHQVEITALVRSLQSEKGITVVAASHDLNLSAAVSDRMVILKGGRVFAEGAPSEVMREEVLEAAYETRVCVEKGRGGLFVIPRFECDAARPDGRGKGEKR